MSRKVEIVIERVEGSPPRYRSPPAAIRGGDVLYGAYIKDKKLVKEILEYGCLTIAYGKTGYEAVEKLTKSWKRCGFLD